MGKNYTTILTLFTVICISLSGCEEEKYSSTTGKLRLAITANGAVTDVTTRSTDENTPDMGNFSMAILQNDKVQASWDKLRDYDEDTTFPVGTYTLKAFYGDLEKEGFESPYYEGSANLNIKGGATTDVEVTCKLSNTKVTIEYTNDFKNYFKTYSATVKSEQGSEVAFASNENRAAYVKPGNISVKVTFTKVNGGVGSTTVEVATIEGAQPQHHYHLQMDVDAGKAMLSVVFDRVTEEKPITLDISDKALNIKAPYFTLTGFEKTSNDTNQWDGNLTEANKLSALLTSLGGFKKCILKTTSPNLPNWPEEGFNLAEDLTAEQQALLTSSGIKLTGFGKNKDQMAIIDFTNVVPHLNISDANDEHLFYLQATSTYGKPSEEYILNLTTPKNFMLMPAEPVQMKSTMVTIPVKLKNGNSQDIKLYYKYYGVMTKINATTISPITDKEGYYNITASGIDMGFVAKDFQAEYNGVKSAIISVAVIIPEYTFKLNTENIWSYSADMTIIPKNTEDLLNLMSAIEPYISLDGSNWSRWEDINLDSSTGKVTLNGLTAGTKYYFRTTCDDGQSFTAPVMYIMEAVTQLKDFTKEWTSYFNENINKGGEYNHKSLWRDVYFDKSTLNVSNINNGYWTSINEKTVPLNPKSKNTWYMVPSTIRQNDNFVLLQNVAWSDNQGDPPSRNDIAASNLSQLTPPTHEHRSVGKLFLGSYSYNHTNDAEVYNEGIEFTSRPIKFKGTYKYEAHNDEGGKVTIAVENREGGQVLPLASGECTLPPTDTEKEFTILLNYTNTDKKATHLRVMFASSTKASSSQSTEDNAIKTSDDKANAVSIGSKLYINKNITLEYK